MKMRLLLLSLMSCVTLFSQEYKYATLEEHRNSQKFIEVEGGKMAYIDVGKGEPILLVHGVPTSSWLYRFMIDSLQNKGYRVISPDLLGFGNSDKPKGYDVYAHEKQADRLFALMDTLKIDTWSQVLHDAGGLWTWEMMLKNKTKIKRLIILNTITNRDGFSPPIRFHRKNIFGRFSISLYGSKMFGKGMMKKTLKFGLTNDELSKEDVYAYWLPMQEGATRVVFHFFTTIKETCHNLDEIVKQFRTYNIPCTIIWGEKDEILEGKKQIPHLTKNLKIAEENVTYLPEGTHFIQEEQYTEISEKIDSFLKAN